MFGNRIFSPSDSPIAVHAVYLGEDLLLRDRLLQVPPAPAPLLFSPLLSSSLLSSVLPLHNPLYLCLQNGMVHSRSCCGAHSGSSALFSTIDAHLRSLLSHVLDADRDSHRVRACEIKPVNTLCGIEKESGTKAFILLSFLLSSFFFC